MKVRITVSEIDGSHDLASRTFTLDLPDPRTTEHLEGPRVFAHDTSSWDEAKTLFIQTVNALGRIRPHTKGVTIEID